MSRASDVTGNYDARNVNREEPAALQPWPIPPTWKWKRMGDVASIIGGGTPRSSEPRYFGGGVPWITPADLSGYSEKYITSGARSITESGLENSGARMMPAGTVLFSSRAPIGYVAIAANPVATNQGFKSFILNDALLPEYVYYWLQRAKEFAVKLASGTTFLEISGKKAAEIPIPVPPLNEQRRIVAAVDEQFACLVAGVAALKRVHANLQRYREALLSAVVYSQVGDHSTGDGWPSKEIRELAAEEPNSIADGPFGSKLKTEHYTNSGPRVIRLQNIGDGRFVDEKAHISEAHFATLSKHRVFPDDLVIAALGEILPRACMVPDDIGPAIVKADCIRFKAGPSVLPKYLQYALNAYPTRQATKARMHGIGRPRLNLSEIKSILVPVPPVAEQRRIVSELDHHLSVVEELEDQARVDFARADRLRESILQSAFVEGIVSPKRVGMIVPVQKESADVPRSKRHFARAVLSAEIVHQLHRESTFGRIKHQKILHLCEHIAKLSEIQGHYHREAAGPLDNKLIYANEAELKRQGWYEAVSRQGQGHAYRRMSKAGGHRKYLERYWGNELPILERLIELMRRWNTERCEIFSTTYAAWNDLILLGRDASDDAIIREILERWHDSKRRISEDRWRKAISWIRQQGFVPAGFGRPTRQT